MSDIDESIFVNVFAIGLQEIQELNALNGTAAAEQLYRLTSGMDRVSLVDVMRDQANRRNKIWSTDGETASQLAALSEQRQKLLREIDELKQRSKRWSHVAAETTDINNQLIDFEAELAKKTRQSRMLEVSVQVAERWNSRKVVIDQIAALGKLPDRRDVSIEKLDQLKSCSEKPSKPKRWHCRSTELCGPKNQKSKPSPSTCRGSSRCSVNRLDCMMKSVELKTMSSKKSMVWDTSLT